LVSTNFGLAYYGAIFGLMIFAENTGVATGPLMAGYVYDAMNTYRLAFIAFLGLTAISVPAVLSIRRPKSLQGLKEKF